jgi:hypothetical protein
MLESYKPALSLLFNAFILAQVIANSLQPLVKQQ